MSKRTGKEVVQEALQLAKTGKHRQALTLLEPYKEHSKIKPLYDKILLDAPELSAWEKLDQKQKNGAVGCLLVLGCMMVMTIYFMIPSNPNHAFARDICNYINHDDDGVAAPYCDTDFLVNNHMEALEECFRTLEESASYDIYIGVGIICLENEGIDLIDEYSP